MKASAFFARLSSTIRDLNADTRPEAINTVIELILLSDERTARTAVGDSGKLTLNAASLDAIFGAG